MRVTLDKENRFLAADGKIDLKQAFMYSGIKAAWCFKKGDTTPELIRELSEEDLVRRGVETFLNDHGTPNEQQAISVEITGIPKLMCMILNNEKQCAADERSLRYTTVQESEYISELEVDLYNKWLKNFFDVLWFDYRDFFMSKAKGETPEEREANARIAAKKIAQENARNFVSILTPTSISYTAPMYQWQRIYRMLEMMVQNPKTRLEQMAVPYAKDLMQQLIDLRVVFTVKDVIQVYPSLLTSIEDDREVLYKHNKHRGLSLFSTNNQFTGLDKPNDFGAAINYNFVGSVSSFAQKHRHRSSMWEMREMEEYSFVTPPFIQGKPLETEYKKDMMLVKCVFPQGQNVEGNLISSVKNIIDYIGKERACDRAQWETEEFFVNELLPKVVEGLADRPEYAKEKALIENYYLFKRRCQFPDFDCPSPCNHKNGKRLF